MYGGGWRVSGRGEDARTPRGQLANFALGTELKVEKVWRRLNLTLATGSS